MVSHHHLVEKEWPMPKTARSVLCWSVNAKGVAYKIDVRVRVWGKGLRLGDGEGVCVRVCVCDRNNYNMAAMGSGRNYHEHISEPSRLVRARVTVGGKVSSSGKVPGGRTGQGLRKTSIREARSTCG